MSKNRIVKFVDKVSESCLQRNIRIKSTVNKFSQLSGLKDVEKFEPESHNELYMKWKNNFLNGWSFSSGNNIYGELKEINDMTSILEALEVNFKIRLNYDLTSSEKKNYLEKIKNLVLSQYYLLSKERDDNYLTRMTKNKYYELIREIWTQLETDLIYQLTKAYKPDNILEKVLSNGIENNVKLWLEAYRKHYYYSTQNMLNNGIIMNYPPQEVIIKNQEEQKVEESMGILKKYKPYAKDLLEDEDKLFQFRRSMRDTSFWNSVLSSLYKKKCESKDEEINFIHIPDGIRKGKEILKLKAETQISEERYIFKNIGDSWLIKFDGKEKHVNCLQGMKYINICLHNPQRLYLYGLLAEKGETENSYNVRVIDDIVLLKRDLKFLEDEYERKSKVEIEGTSLSAEREVELQKIEEAIKIKENEIKRYNYITPYKNNNTLEEKVKRNVQKNIREAKNRIKNIFPEFYQHLNLHLKIYNGVRYDSEIDWN